MNSIIKNKFKSFSNIFVIRNIAFKSFYSKIKILIDFLFLKEDPVIMLIINIKTLSIKITERKVICPRISL